MSPRPRSIVFDLDGTLIDSAPGILAAFAGALGESGIVPRVALDAKLIGPPLAETLTQLTGIHDEETLALLIAGFKRSYDQDGVAATLAYPGIDGLLRGLHAEDRPLYIATNKRLNPTRLILNRLGWVRYFRAVHAIDMYATRLPNKAVMIARLLEEHGLAGEDCIYVGDKREDGEAAVANGMHFLGVDWGYNEVAWPSGWQSAARPEDLATALR